ncbi:MAG: homoserine kinase [Chloroflexi bacterium]|nr:homoserine kinase [Chloroflexota bacterium]
MSPHRVTVRVPATTANLGPAFDCMGIALDMHNQVTAALSPEMRIVNMGEGAERLPTSAQHRVYQAIEQLYNHLGRPIPTLSLQCTNTIPLLRGLGSSAAAVVAGLVAANALAGSLLSAKDLLPLAAATEGHPDNAAPALFGGCQLCVQDQGKWLVTSVPLPASLRFVLFIPDFTMPTKKARAVLPRHVPRDVLVFNTSRTALLVNALATGRTELLSVATQDQVHQPPRQSLFPAMPHIIAAAREAGALGAFLSGAGSTIAAMVNAQAEEVAQAMAQAAHKEGVKGEARIVSAALKGAEVIEAA